MPNPTYQSTHIDVALTNMSVAYKQSASNFIAEQAFPSLPVPKETGLYWKYEKGAFFRDEARKRAPATESAGGGFKLGTDSYITYPWAIHKDVTRQELANADEGIDPFSDATEWCMQQLLIRRERLFVDAYMKTSVWGTDVVGNTNFAYWNDEAASDPAEDFKVARRTILASTAHKPNTLIVGYDVHEALKKHPLITKNFKYTGATSITNQMIAQYFELDKYLVSEAVYASSDETLDATPTMNFITGKDALLCYSVPSPSLLKPTAGYIFTWSGLTGLNNAGILTKRIPMSLKDDAERVESQMNVEMKVVAPDMGYFFSGCVS